LAAISAMEAFVMRFLCSAAAVVSFTFFQKKRLYLHSRQGLVMVDLLDNFLNPLKLFMALANDFTKWP
jgi:hypothetical protein